MEHIKLSQYTELVKGFSSEAQLRFCCCFIETGFNDLKIHLISYHPNLTLYCA